MQSEEYRKLSQELQDSLSRLINKRRNWESHWQEVSDYCLPRKSEINKERSPGDKRHQIIFDATAMQALELLAASLHGMLTSSANRWFALRFKERSLNDIDEAKEWLDDSTNKMYDAFNKSNFQQEVFEVYHDLIAFGTACLLIEEDKDDVIRFSARHIKEIYIQENEKGFIDFIYRRFKMPIANIVKQFGYDNVSKDVQRKIKTAPQDELEIVHCVKPRGIYDDRKLDKKNMPFLSIYFEMENGHIISIGGFKEARLVFKPFAFANNRTSCTNVLTGRQSMRSQGQTL